MKMNAKMKSLKGLIKHLHSVKEPSSKMEEMSEPKEIQKMEEEMNLEGPSEHMVNGDKEIIKKAELAKKKGAKS